MRKIILCVVMVGILLLTIYASITTIDLESHELMTEVLSLYLNTGASNAVTAVYLDYRIFDTLFETFLLLVSTLGLSQFLRLEQTEKIHVEAEEHDNYKPSPIASGSLHLILPLFIIFGISITAFGPYSPGGGFQGGAILAVLVMVLYLTDKHINLPLLAFESLEKIIYILFLVLVSLYFLFYTFADSYRFLYMIFTNIFISLKVFMGLIIIFLRLIGQSQHRTLGDAYE